MSLWELELQDETLPCPVPVQEAVGEFKLNYEGIPITFPYQPYESQQAMMQKIIRGVSHSENCLLESPTGTGKTAALLCSLLAWQKFDIERQPTYLSPKKFKLDLEDNKQNDVARKEIHSTRPTPSSSPHCKKALVQPSSPLEDENDLFPFDDAFDGVFDDDFMPDPPGVTELNEIKSKGVADLPTQVISDTDNYSVNNEAEVSTHASTNYSFANQETQVVEVFDKTRSTGNMDSFDKNNSLFEGKNGKKDDDPESKPEECVTIYYATRTHSQIKSVVKQLKQTKYSNTPMAILASRTQTCINPKALLDNEKGVDDMCEILRNPDPGPDSSAPRPPPQCPYFDQNPKHAFDGFARSRQFTPWDIEDIQKYGSECSSCPYYGIRAIQEKARIVFCTYNHLLHKHIRKASKILIDGNILVFDEAHNIEELCLKIASDTISLDSVYSLRFELDKAMKAKFIPGEKKNALQDLDIAVNRLSTWLDKESKSDAPGFKEVKEFGKPYSTYTKDLTENVVKVFSDAGFGPSELRSLREAFFTMENKNKGPPFDAKTAAFKIPPKQMRSLGRLLFALNFLLKRKYGPGVSEEFVNLGDFKVFLRKSYEPKIHVELHLNCLSPAIAFGPMKKARTVIVTSGTLSPITSFASELEMKFEHTLSARHVLGPDRIYSAVITRLAETSDKCFDFSYKSLYQQPLCNYNHHQKELGDLLRLISEKFQYGVLVFGTSKSFMSKLKESWLKNGILEELRRHKDVYFEHDTWDGPGFNKMLEDYKRSTSKPRGAILLGFVRGRASEGIDFKDNEARVVVTVGIPFLPYKDEAIVAKMAYNDKKHREDKEVPKKCLDGRSWYEGGTFRALNQAFGRCVRHSKDWGIIFIVDGRLNNPKYKSYLSTWVKETMCVSGRVGVGSLQLAFPHVHRFVQNIARDTD